MKSSRISLSALTIILLAGISCSSTPDITSYIPVRNDGAEILNIPVNGSLQNPAWAPNSNELLFTSFPDGYNSGNANLNVFETGSGKNRVLVSTKNPDINMSGTSWNRKTDHIVYSSSRKSNNEIYTIYAYGRSNNGWQVTDCDASSALEPSLSPDGEWIVFSGEDGVISKYKIDDSQPCRTLTPAADNCRQPNWSPAGDLIVYQKFSEGSWNIWTMGPDGGNRQPVTSGSGNKTCATFSPNGKWIVYSDDEGTPDSANLYIIKADGGTPVQLTDDEGFDSSPSWSPDGQWIAFESSPENPSASGGTKLWRIRVPSQFALQHLFTGDFETGDFSQWYSVSWNQNRPMEEQIQVVSSPVRQGKYAVRMTVHDGDQFLNTSGERVQLERTGPNEQEGDEYWYAWSTLFPDDWQPPDDWQVIIDWHASADYSMVCQVLQLEIDNDNAIGAKMLAGDVSGYRCFNGSGTAVSQSEIIVDRITRGLWNDFVIHVRWTTSNRGIIEIWHKLETDPAFKKVVDWEGIPTLQYKGDPSNPDQPYLLLANYRDASNRHTSVLYHDGFRMTTSAEKLAEDGLYDIRGERPAQ